MNYELLTIQNFLFSTVFKTFPFIKLSNTKRIQLQKNETLRKVDSFIS